MYILKPGWAKVFQDFQFFCYEAKALSNPPLQCIVHISLKKSLVIIGAAFEISWIGPPISSDLFYFEFLNEINKNILETPCPICLKNHKFCTTVKEKIDLIYEFKIIVAIKGQFLRANLYVSPYEKSILFIVFITNEKVIFFSTYDFIQETSSILSFCGRSWDRG